MNMEFGHEMSLEQQLELHTSEIHDLQTNYGEISEDVDKLMVWVRGNGDPTKSLLWIAAELMRITTEQGKLITTLTQMQEAVRLQYAADSKNATDALANHVSTDGHVRRGDTWNWRRFSFDVAKPVVAWGLIGILAFASGHVHISVGP